VFLRQTVIIHEGEGLLELSLLADDEYCKGRETFEIDEIEQFAISDDEERVKELFKGKTMEILRRLPKGIVFNLQTVFKQFIHQES